MEKKILLVINTNNLFIIDSGAALRNTLFLKALAEIGHVDVVCFSRNDLVSNISNCNVIFSKVIWDSKNYKEVFRTILCMTLRPSNPYSYFQLNKEKASIIKNFINNTKYDIIACRYVETAIVCGLLDYKDKLVVDADDNLAVVRKFQAFENNSILYKWKRPSMSLGELKKC